MRSEATPDVTVVIPAHNGRQVLGRTLQSALNQQDVRASVIVVDDGSTDGTADAVDALGVTAVTVVRQPASGVSAARNAGLAAVTTEWVAFLDQDDLWAPDKLVSQIAAVTRADAGFAYVASVRVNADLVPLHVDAPVPGPEQLRAALAFSNPIPGGGSNVLARTSVARDVGGFETRLDAMEDWDFWVRLAAATSGASCSRVLLAHVQHPASATVSHSYDVDAELALVSERIARAGLAPGVRTTNVEPLRANAQAYWRVGRRGDALREIGRALRRARRHDFAYAYAQLRGLPHERQRLMTYLPQTGWLDALSAYPLSLDSSP